MPEATTTEETLYRPICCVCKERYGEPRTCDNSHGYCNPCARETAKVWFKDDPERLEIFLSRLEGLN